MGSTCVVSQCRSPEQIRVCSRALCCSHSLGNPSTKLSVKGKASTLGKLLNFQFGFNFVTTNEMFCLQLCVLHCLAHEGRAPHIYCRGRNVDKLVQPQPPTCPVPPASPLPPPLSPAPPLPAASSLPPVLPLIPALPLAL